MYGTPIPVPVGFDPFAPALPWWAGVIMAAYLICAGVAMWMEARRVFALNRVTFE